MATSIMFMPLQHQKVRKARIFRGFNCLQGLTDDEVRKRYRLGREGLKYLCALLQEDLERPTNRNCALRVEKQVLIALRFYASGNFLQVIGDTMGIDKGTVSVTIKRVTDVLVSMANQFIRWPSTEERLDIKKGFYCTSKFPNVIGCIDGTHIRIQAPSVDENAFVNRKGYHSINVQAVCDHEGRLININSSWPGSVHDAHIFRTSQIRTHMEEGGNGKFENGILLGDSGYACRPFLLTPYLNPQTAAQERFNNAHAKARSQIERTFGQLKRRFHVLHSEIRMRPDRVCRIIIACAVLHNICKRLGEPEEDDYFDDNQPQLPPYQGQQDGKSIRDYVTQHFFSRE